MKIKISIQLFTPPHCAIKRNSTENIRCNADELLDAKTETKKLVIYSSKKKMMARASCPVTCREKIPEPKTEALLDWRYDLGDQCTMS